MRVLAARDSGFNRVLPALLPLAGRQEVRGR
jgi:hypothetical protein